MTNGVDAADFSGTIMADEGRVLSYQIVTKSTDPTTGSEILSFATAANRTMVFFLEKNRYVWDKAGLLEVGDAYLMATPSQAIKRFDRFTVDGSTYYIDNTTERWVMGVHMCTFAVAFLVDD